MPRILLLVFLAMTYILPVCAQKKYTVSGYIKDSKSGEVLNGATVYVPKLQVGLATNAYGFYSITLPADSEMVIFTFYGYKPQVKQIFLKEDLKLNIEMISTGEKVTQVEVRGSKARENIEKAQMSVIDIPIASIKELPAIAGEKDLFKVLQLLPGVQSGSEGSANFYVRGGGPDQNLILLDEAIVYSPFHLLGFFSTFNTDAIKSAELIKGGFPAQYGGRLSSIVDVTMKEGNDKEFHGSGGIGLIASRLLLEGPILKNKASFMISARRTYIDVLTAPFFPKDQSAGYHFYDVNGKINYKFSDNDRVFLSAYIGRDVFKFSNTSNGNNEKFNTNWGNSTVTARWNHLFSQKLFSNTSFIYNDYVFNIGNTQKTETVNLSSGIRDLNGKTDFEWFGISEHKIKFGATYSYQRFTPQAVSGSFGSNDFSQTQTKYVTTGAAYINDEFKVSKNLSLAAGLRIPAFFYKQTTYINAEPRFTARYALDRNTSIKAGYAYMNQYIHLISNSTASLPTDLWIPSSDVVKPQKAQQGSVGIFHNFLKDLYESSVEVYYKDMRNQIEYKEGANIFLNPNIDKELVFGHGWSYGTEFFLRKNEGKFTGWIGYTLAWALRNFPDLNNGNNFYAKYDRRHDVSVTGIYNINKSWAFSFVFVYGSGSSISLPAGSFTVPLPDHGGGGTTLVDEYTARNSFKLRDFNRLDIGIKRTRHHKRWESELRFDIYNVYSRRNPYFDYITNEVDPRSNADRPVVKQVSILPMLPSISYNFIF